MRRILSYCLFGLTVCFNVYGQVDTTFIYNSSMPYGSLDIRIANSPTSYYYLQENKTFSFRENAGVKTGTYLDMTTWDSSPYMEGNLREKNSSVDDFVMNYRLLLPEGYNASYAKGYPMIVIFHGLGERGNCSDRECYHANSSYSPITNTPPAPTNSDFELLNNDHQLANGGNIHLRARNAAGSKLPDDPTLGARAFPGFILMPQNMNGWEGPSVQDAIRIVRLISKKYNIDENRIYIHGLSNGGHGVNEAIKRAPWLFAASLTMSAINDGFINTQGLAPSVAHIPMWIFQGAKDTNPYPQKTENYVKQFRNAGAVVRYTKYENLGHGTWGSAYNEPDFFTWILGKNKANIHVFSGNATICGGSGLTLELPAGYLAYEWRLNGQAIGGATSNTYLATATGTYTARFSRVTNPTEAQWNRLSDPIEVKNGTPLAQAEITQHGTVLLKDLNNTSNAHLEAKGKFDHYYWYKDGNLVDFPGDQDDTVKHAYITPTMGKGVYTLVASNFDNCVSPVSTGKYLFFNNSAPLTITAPTNLAGSVTSSSEVTLTWTDASDNEGGFEIWHRRKIDATNFSIWEMPALTGTNINTFKVTKLFPSSTYQFKIRAVSNTARSEYAPSATTSIELTTTADQEPPSAPQNLTVNSIGVSKLKLKWSPSTDNTGIMRYHIYYGTIEIQTLNADTTAILADLPINTNFDFTVKAIDLAGNASAPSNTRQGSTYLAGLYYEHSTALVQDLDSIDWTIPEFTGIVQTFTLKPKTQEDYFNFRFDGFIYITSGGSYQFRTSSDDGSRLRLNNVVLVENDGVHKLKTVESAAKTLATGEQRITVDFFDYIESDSLNVQYKGADTNNEWITIPNTVLKSAENVVTGIEDNGPEDSFILSIYPNPSTQDNINVKLQSVQNSPVQLQLIDMVGKNFLSQIVDLSVVSEGIKLSPAETLRPGIYIVIAKQGNTTTRQRVIIKQ